VGESLKLDVEIINVPDSRGADCILCLVDLTI